MATIDDITDYIIFNVRSEERRVSLINMKIQKLLYYIQAWSYGINKSPLFEGEFEAWIHGPINRHIYDRFCEQKSLYSEIDFNDMLRRDVELPENIAEFVDFVLENYVKYSVTELELLIQEEMPWIRTRGQLNRYEKCNKVISEDLLMEYYGKRWEEITKAQ